MSSRQFAELRRSVLYELEALEPRRFLSVESRLINDLPLEIHAETQISGSFAKGERVHIAFNTTEGTTYLFTDDTWDTGVILLAEDGETRLEAVHQDLGLVWGGGRGRGLGGR